MQSRAALPRRRVRVSRNAIDIEPAVRRSKDCSKLFGWAILDAIGRDGAGTRYRYSEWRPLVGSTQELVLLESGEPIKAGFIRPYALCRTPWFLRYRHSNRARAARSWVLKGNPSRNDLDDMLEPHAEQTWVTESPPRDWAAGDFLFCWKSSPAKQVAGLARIASIHNRAPANTKARFGIEYLTGPLTHRLGIDALRRDPDLREAGFLKQGPAGTVFRLSPRQARRLAELVCERTPSCIAVFEDHLGVPFARRFQGRHAQDGDLGFGFDIDEAEFFDAHEGRLILAQHLRRERDRGLAAGAKADHLRRTGGLRCMACGFDFAESYGEVGHGYAEVHHAVPLSTYVAEGANTRIEDLAIVCSNCHRMLHRKRPWLTLDELRTLCIREKRSMRSTVSRANCYARPPGRQFTKSSSIRPSAVHSPFKKSSK